MLIVTNFATILSIMSTHQSGRKEVQRAALLSIFAALLLTGTKLIVGMMTNSLGILSEALHSGLDLSAAGITYLAVRRASLGPDSDHQYGHGKVENFAALAETVILWITSIWIINEALNRIQLQEWAAASIFGIGVMVMSILVDYERSRRLYRVAKEHGSQALEADALHFSTDMFSSIVVLIGLGFVWIGIPIADPLAAIGVAFVIFFASYRLARRAYDVLVDKAPPGVRESVDEICCSIQGVVRCERIRTRTSGPELFIDVTIVVDENLAVSDTATIAEQIENALAGLAPNVDVVVQMIPLESENILRTDFDVYGDLKAITRSMPEVVGIHNVRVAVLPDGTHITADLEMPPDFTLDQAHDVSRLLEEKIRERVPTVKEVTLHLESADIDHDAIDITTERSEIAEAVIKIVNQETPAHHCHNVIVTMDHDGIMITLDCKVDGNLTLKESHEIADLVEKLVKQAFPDVSSVVVHMEPL